MTTESWVTFDGDSDSTVDTSLAIPVDNACSYTDGNTITAETIMTLAGATSSMVPYGTLTVMAKEGIYITGGLNQHYLAEGKRLTINGDYDSSKDTGTVTVAATKIRKHEG